MRLGISITSSHGTATGPDAVGAVLDRARAAAEAGLDHLSLGDHHATGPNSYVQNVPMIGRILADWPHRGPGARPIGLLLLLPLWNPVLAAEQVATLASLTDARFIVQTGIGSGAGQFAGIGASLGSRGATTDAAISVMKRLLAGESVTDDRWGIADSTIAPLPPKPVEWWIGGGSGERPLERAAAEGDAWYVAPGTPAQELGPAIERYRQRCEHHGTRPRVCLRRDVFVADDDTAALAAGQAVVDSHYRGMTLDVLVVGGVERVVERLAAFAELGVDDIVARTISVPGLIEGAAAVHSVELLGQVRSQLPRSAGSPRGPVDTATK